MRSSLHTTLSLLHFKEHLDEKVISLKRLPLFSIRPCLFWLRLVRGPFSQAKKNERTKQHNEWVELKAESEITISKAGCASGESDGDIRTGIQNTIQILPLACHKSCFPSLYLKQIQFSSPLLKHREKKHHNKTSPPPPTHTHSNPSLLTS